MKKGTFMWAVAQMKEGKKVRRNNTQSKGFTFIDEKGILTTSEREEGEPYPLIDLGVIEATDWEIVKNITLKEVKE